MRGIGILLVPDGGTAKGGVVGSKPGKYIPGQICLAPAAPPDLESLLAELPQLT
jgi:hypothetical protein